MTVPQTAADPRPINMVAASKPTESNNPSSSPMPIPCKIPIPCFVSQFPLKNSQFRYTGNFAGKSLELLTD